MPDPIELQIEAALEALLHKRGPGKSICPSEVARLLAGEIDWRPLVGPVRQVVIRLARDNLVQITQRGEAVDPDNFKGPIRIRQSTPS